MGFIVTPLLEPLLEPPLDPVPPELLPEPPPELLDPLLELDVPPELLLEPELLLDPELLPEPDPPPSVPPSVFPVNVAPPHAHIVAAPATIQSFVRMAPTSALSCQQARYQRITLQFQPDCSPSCAVPRTPTSW